MIPAKLSRIFPVDVRARGENYFRQGRARIARADSRTIVAVVRGTLEYAVKVTALDGVVRVECACPYAAEWGVCKHQWAVLRQVDTTGQLAALISTAGPHALFTGSPEIDEDDFDEDGLDEDGPEDPYGQPLWDTTGEPMIHRAPARSARWPVARHDRRATRPPQPPPPPEWKRLLDAAAAQMRYEKTPRMAPPTWPGDRRLVYIIDLDATSLREGIVVGVGTEKLKKDGTWDAPKKSLSWNVWLEVPERADRQIAQMLIGASATIAYAGVPTSGFVVARRALETTMRLICETGRARVLTHGQFMDAAPRWDDGPPWKFRLRVQRQQDGTSMLTGTFHRDAEDMALAEPVLVHSGGFLFTRSGIARFDHDGAFALVSELRGKKSVPVANDALGDLLEALHRLPAAPAIELPPDAGLRTSDDAPVPYVSLRPNTESWRSVGKVVSKTSFLTLEFQYGSLRVGADAGGATLFDRSNGIVHHRHHNVEATARERVLSLGATEGWDHVNGRKGMVVAQTRLAYMVAELIGAGWTIAMNGAPFRAPGTTRADVRSGIDWFDLVASVTYGDMDVALPSLLDALQQGEDVITLEDGSLGLLPREWLTRLGAVSAGGETTNGRTRFQKSQIGLLDALLAAMPEVNVDATFTRARDELRTFDRVEPMDPPATFTGTLREYQREGLGWLHFLRRFGLGGCLADDMGLGKTVQVLALLDARRLEGAGPSLVVVPRSLVFNWIREAQRFAPALRVMDYSGKSRDASTLDPGAVDIVLTTYGTLRRDAATLGAIEFEYAILDEAQAIKNAGSASAKAARLLRARHRLAMSGTPIENRIGELWSLFEFLNPGMLGASSRFASLARVTTGEKPSGGGRELLARALRPVILRRTKDRVAPELPPRMEQTLEVELEPQQRRFYDALRESYRQSVLKRVDRDGIKKSRMHILEALLRLRQAACHPVLADPRKGALPSAKLDALQPAISEVVSEGHKALVFSQFTGFLALVRERLEKADVMFEYLDGKTRDRQVRVDRFQNDPTCPVFLISLRAGGHGLNLTAADYVFILDPWWNPAVEAQAIDRTHRIGQMRRVIATRLVARDTIEEKILELQASKRSLADAILSADDGVLSQIGREELELLLA